MADHTNNVSGGLSLLLKTARPGRAEPMIGGNTANRNVTTFFNDLDQARQQQLDKTRAEPAAPSTQRLHDEANQNAVMAIDSQSTLPVTAMSLKKGREAQALNTEAMQLLQKQSAASTPGSSDTASDIPASAPITKVRNGVVGEIVTQGTLAGRSRRLANGSVNDGLPKVSPIEAQPAADVADRLMPTEINEAATALPPEARQRPNNELIKPAAMAVDSNGKVAGTETLSQKDSEFQVSNTEAKLRLDVTSTPVVSDAASNMTSPMPTAGALDGTIEEIVTQGTLAGRSGQLANAVEKTTGMANTPGLSRENSRLSGEGAKVVMTAPEPLVSDQAVKSTLAQKNAMGLIQISAGNGIVTQATLAGRLRQQNSDATENGAEVLRKTGDSGLLQTGIAPLNARGPDRLPASNVPVPNESLSGIDSLTEFTNGNKTVHQRIATTEAMLAQMAVEAGTTVVKVPTADNMLLALSGATAAATAVQHSDSVAGPIIQAPLNIPLDSDDAETALAGNVKWMTNEGVKNAVMTVTPHGMGPISIKIGIDGNQMDVSIIASQHTTRDALESMLPRLREQLAVQGHESVKVDVSDGKSEQSRSGNGQTFAESRNPAGSTPQDNQSNSSKNGEKREYGGSEKLEVVSESFMAEDLQRVAARVVGEVDSRPVFDAYV